MITWRIWQAMNQPPRAHYLFRMTAPEPRHLPAQISGKVLVGGTVLLTLAAFFSREFSSMLSLLILLAIPLTAAGIMLTGPIDGLRWAVRAGRALARLRSSGLYTPLCLTPAGAFSINWIVCVGVLHKIIRNPAAEPQSLWPMRLFLILPLTVFLSIQPRDIDRPAPLGLVMGLYLALLVAWFLIEDAQSMALGGLLGMLIPVHARDPFEVNLGTVVGYVSIQFVAYTLAILMWAVIVPYLYNNYSVTGWLADFGRLAITLGILFTTREIILGALWQHLSIQFNTEPEVRLPTGYRVY